MNTPPPLLQGGMGHHQWVIMISVCQEEEMMPGEIGVGGGVADRGGGSPSYCKQPPMLL